MPFILVSLIVLIRTQHRVDVLPVRRANISNVEITGAHYFQQLHKGGLRLLESLIPVPITELERGTIGIGMIERITTRDGNILGCRRNEGEVHHSHVLFWIVGWRCSGEVLTH